ncbi:MAG: TetR/AcrR family transcriptional regulator [Phycisphaerales bacterium]|nr:TetR/AcrR family transcriptional regulator [Phycisphaerales bacterium]
MASAKREKLLNVARKLFETEGFHTTGIDRVLSEAGVAKMTLYNNFGSKDGLIVAVLEQTSQDMISRLREVVTQSSNDPYEQILGVFDAFAHWFSDPEFCGCMFQAAVAEFPDPESKPSQAARNHQVRVCQLFEDFCSSAGLPNPATLGQMLAMLASGASCTARQIQTREPAEHARQIAEILLERACSGDLAPKTELFQQATT